MLFRLGIDLGGTNIAVAAVTEDYKICASVSRPTRLAPTFEGVCTAIAELCTECAAKLGASVEDALSVGIGSPGIVNSQAGLVERWSNLHFVNAPLAPRLSELLGKKVFIENDANAAALGEYVAGAGRGSQSFAAVTLGTGIGCGAVLGGRLYSGINHAAFELGHMVIDRSGPPCTCGRRGCFEALASATALGKMAESALTQHPESLIGTFGAADGRAVFQALALGDETAKSVVGEYVSNLACGVINLINLLQPEIVCIGGGVSNAGEALLAPLRRIIDAEEYAKDCPVRTKIVKAQLGNDAGILGAALLPLYNN